MVKSRHSAEQIVSKLRETEVAVPRSLFEAILERVRSFAAVSPRAGPA